MSVEGMWCLVSGNVITPDMNTGGIVILDTQRLYGGDSVMAYVGRYEFESGRVFGTVESFKYNPGQQGLDVFGEEAGPMRSTDFDLNLNEEGFLVGKLTRDEIEIPIILQKLRELP